ncbi:uncharacterized protein LOC116661759 isoform X4 [Camelus ferus]|uniref:Uncharacterized protein LOC116661759 isoform X4 n=1 Tax=Camelus ferus TaxID=419612 RepID=A0A8B8SIW6_CAMFR|nr:uncharacterized protein LOC116661759 isoform X4 [Camelus ferus]
MEATAPLPPGHTGRVALPFFPHFGRLCLSKRAVFCRSSAGGLIGRVGPSMAVVFFIGLMHVCGFVSFLSTACSRRVMEACGLTWKRTRVTRTEPVWGRCGGRNSTPPPQPQPRHSYLIEGRSAENKRKLSEEPSSRGTESSALCCAVRPRGRICQERTYKDFEDPGKLLPSRILHGCSRSCGWTDGRKTDRMEAPPHPLDPLAQEDRDGSGKDSSDEGLGMDFLCPRKVFLHKEEERGVLGQRARTASFQGSAPVRVGVGVRTQPPTAPLPRLGSPTWETLLPAPSPIFSSAGLQLPRANHLSHAAGLSSSLGCQEALPLLHVLWLGIPDKHKRCWWAGPRAVAEGLPSSYGSDFYLHRGGD